VVPWCTVDLGAARIASHEGDRAAPTLVAVFSFPSPPPDVSPPERPAGKSCGRSEGGSGPLLPLISGWAGTMFHMLRASFINGYGGGGLGLRIRCRPGRIWSLHGEGLRRCVAGAAAGARIVAVAVAGVGGPGGGSGHVLTPVMGRAGCWWPTTALAAWWRS
jgi:hypothetical protein